MDEISRLTEGILSFYRSLDGERIHTSTAQMFDERGEGLILRGGRMVESEEDDDENEMVESTASLGTSDPAMDAAASVSAASPMRDHC